MWRLLWNPEEKKRFGGLTREQEATCRSTVENSRLYTMRHRDVDVAWLKEDDLAKHKLTAWHAKVKEDQLAGIANATGVPLTKSSTAGSSQSRFQSAA